ncbi:MAG: IclR family transcriptional regulator C-terminal domain-containing protein [Baekduia sp.]
MASNSSDPGLLDDDAERPREFVQSLARGLSVIRSFGDNRPELTVTEIAGTTGLTRAAARRFLITLSELGYVETDGRMYRLTPRVLDLGYAYLSGLSFPEAALPHLEHLVAEVEESSEASILDLPDIVYVARVPSPTTITITVNVGARMPTHATAMGHVLLADLEPDAFDRYLSTARLEGFLPNTITEPKTLRREVARVREQGYAIVDQELEEGLIAIAVPVRPRDERAVGTINLSTHVARRDVRSLERELLGPLQRTAAAIEADLASASS